MTLPTDGTTFTFSAGFSPGQVTTTVLIAPWFLDCSMGSKLYLLLQVCAKNCPHIPLKVFEGYGIDEHIHPSVLLPINVAPNGH